MSLGHLHVHDLRCIEGADLELDPGFNLIWGGNGAGKTSLLEAVFLLGRGRSFRTRYNEQLIRRTASGFLVTGRTLGPIEKRIGVAFDRKQGLSARADGVPVKLLADLSFSVPVQAIDPGVHKLIEEGGYRRRRWLDWAVFHVEPEFGMHWYRYSRALRQRNAALKERAVDAMPWEIELAGSGEWIGAARRQVLQLLEPYWRKVLAALECPAAELNLAQGWPEELSLSDAIKKARARDELRQTSTVGPHRADVRITVAGKAARDVLSRGQQKLLASALSMAQLRLLKDRIGLSPTLLLDDPAAELDAVHLAAFVAEISALGCQLIATALQPEIRGFQIPNRVFHVEQGCLRPV